MRFSRDSGADRDENRLDRPVAEDRPFQKAVIVNIIDGYLNACDHIVIRLGVRLGGGPGTRVQTFCASPPDRRMETGQGDHRRGLQSSSSGHEPISGAGYPSDIKTAPCAIDRQEEIPIAGVDLPAQSVPLQNSSTERCVFYWPESCNSRCSKTEKWQRREISANIHFYLNARLGKPRYQTNRLLGVFPDLIEDLRRQLRLVLR
jgi:hypothetical protein